MGRAKAQWMEEEALQPMYDWIEENYGDISEEDDPEEWQEAIEAFDDYVDKIQDLEYQDHLAEEYYYYIKSNLQKVDDIFSQDLSELLHDVKSQKPETPHFYWKMTYAHGVTIFEAYMEGVIKTLLTRNDHFLYAYLKHSQVIGNKQYSLKDFLFGEADIKASLDTEVLRKEVLAHLSNTLYHDIHKLKKTFEWILERKIAIEDQVIKKIVSIRHDIVHRNGKNKNGKIHDINQNTVLDALNDIQLFSQCLRSEIGAMNMNL